MQILNNIDEINEGLDDAGDVLNVFSESPEGFIAVIVIILLLFLVYILYLHIISPEKSIKSKLTKKLRTRKKSDTIPCNGDLYVTYYVASKCNIIDYLSLKGNLISSFYLKWIKKGLLKIKAADKKDNEAILCFDDTFINCLDDEIEKELYTITKKVLSMANAESFKADDLIKNLTNENIGLTQFFTHVYKKAKERAGVRYYSDKDLSELAHYGRSEIIRNLLAKKREIVEFMNFIKDETLIDKYEFESIQMWDNYFIFANLLGLRKNKKKLWFNDKINQHFIEISKTTTFDNIDAFIHSVPVYSKEELLKNKNIINKSIKNYQSMN